MTDTWARHLEEFQELATPLLQDADGLAALLVAAAGAMGCAALAPPLVRRGPDGLGAVLLANEAHLVLHASAAGGWCLLTLVGRDEDGVRRARDVIARRLAGANGR